MKIYLDDIRFPKNGEGKTIIRNYDDFVFTWDNNKNKIDYISFDHDLGNTEKTGYDCLKIVEEDIMLGNIKHFVELNIHSANPVGVIKMQPIIKRLYEFMTFDN